MQSLCTFEDTIGGVSGKFYASFDDHGQLSMLSISDLDASEFGAVADALTKKFGKPALSRAGTVSNAMGAHFPDRIMVWAGKGWKLQAHQRSESVLKSSVEYLTSAKEREIDKQAANKKDDI